MIRVLTVAAVMLCAAPAWAQLVPWWNQLPQTHYGTTQTYQPTPVYNPPQSWSGQRIGNFDYWHGSNGQNITCQTIGQFHYCN